MGTMLNDVKLMLDINDSDQDKLISLIIRDVTDSLTQRLRVTSNCNDMAELVDNINTDLQHVIRNVSVSRYNRIGDEGLTSATSNGFSMTFASLFDGYQEDLENFIKVHYPYQGDGLMFFI